MSERTYLNFDSLRFEQQMRHGWNTDSIGEARGLTPSGRHRLVRTQPDVGKVGLEGDYTTIFEGRSAIWKAGRLGEM